MVIQRFQNDLEADFARYLEEQLALVRGTGWDYEPKIPGASKRPDFAIRRLPRALLLDAKQFDPPSEAEWENEISVGPRAFDPGEGARAKIHEARRKFREFKGRFPCGLVLRSGAYPEQNLDHPMQVFAAMLGSLGVQWPIDTTGTARPELGGQAFLGGGKMIDPKTRKPQNTTIGAIVALRSVHVYRGVLEQVLKRLPRMKRRAAGEDKDAMAAVSRITMEQLGSNERFQRIRKRVDRVSTELARRGLVEKPPILGVRVHLNPFSRIPFPVELFRGPVDEVWRYDVARREVVCDCMGSALVRGNKVADDTVQALHGDSELGSATP